MSSIRVTITKELEPVISFLEKQYEGLNRSELVKLALSTLKKESEATKIRIPKDLPEEYGTPTLEKEVKDAMKDYKKGRFITLSTPQEIEGYFDKLNREVDEEQD